jgi:glycosyltransferase involved in cell wall biosynthesis
VRRKGLDRLLRAIARPECAAVRLAVIGSGPEREPLVSLAHDLGVEDRVQFLGRVDEERKWQTLNAADLYVSASMHEGFGLVYVEAMACGLPVVTPDCGGQTDFLSDGETGYVVKAGSQDALSDALARSSVRRREMRSMGEENRARAREFYVERCARSYERLFLRVLRSEGRERVRPGVTKTLNGILAGLLPLTDPGWAEQAAGLIPLLGG